MSRPAMPYAMGGAPMLSPAELQKFEAPLIALANLSGGDLRKLFYAFFSFLNRRTDFYCIMPSDGAGGRRMGFQEGQAEQMLLASFRQFPLRRMGPKPGSAGSTAAKSPSVPAPAAKKAPDSNSKDMSKEEPTKDEKKAGATLAKEESKPKSEESSTKTNKEKGKAEDSTSKPDTKAKPAKSKSDTIRYTEEGKQIPIGNGGSTSRYVWTQTLEEVTVHVPLPEGTRGKDLDVKISANALSIRQKTEESGSSSFGGTLFAKIRPDESTWTIETTTHSDSQKVTTLQLILEKVQKTWWDIVLSGDKPLIDTTMVDSTRHIGTYDEDTQGQIRRILFDQRQERLGLPTSQQIMLKDLPPMPNGEKLEGTVSLPDGGTVSLPSGVEYIDQEKLDKATIK